MNINWQLVITDALIICILFHLAIFLVVRYHPEWEIDSYPDPIIDRLIELGKIEPREKVPFSQKAVKKLPAAVFFAVLIGTLLFFINKTAGFWPGAISCYVIWLIVDWYDALILDCLWFAHSKACRLEGTEDLDKAYKDYWFYIKGSLTGMVIGIPVALAVGMVTELLGRLG